MKLYKLDNVEIFRTGKWHDVMFTEKHIDEMVDNFNRFSGSWFRPALIGGHPPDNERAGKPALGYAGKLWRVGKKLLANFVDMPLSVYNAIKSHGYDRVSVELWPEQERNGKVYKNVLKGIALLGIEVPEVDGLKPLSESFSGGTDSVSLTTFLSIDGEQFTRWTDAYINGLPDAAFAVIENPEDKTAKARHLPHHKAAVSDPGDSDTVDKSHLTNALARLETFDISEDAKATARTHLEAHAKALGVEIPAKQEVNKMTDKEKFEAEKKKLEDEKKKQADDLLKLSADLAKANEEIKKLSAKDPKDGDSTKEIETLQAKVKSDGDKIVELQNAARTTRIDGKVKECRVPALQPFIREFYELASKTTDTIKFSADGKDPVDTQPEHVVDQLVNYMNKATETLFESHSVQKSFERDDTPPNENIREEVDNKVKKYQAENKDVDYNTAMAVVFAADPELKEAYARS